MGKLISVDFNTQTGLIWHADRPRIINRDRFSQQTITNLRDPSWRLIRVF
jgi:hypothetical protein